jgi:hypothetical protein
MTDAQTVSHSHEAMNLPYPSNGQRYLESFKDKDGDWLDGAKTYRLHVPAKQFWSVTVYDNLTRSLTRNRTNRWAITSYDNIKINNDGSAELYFGPTTPASLESNWVDTSASKGWFAWFRFYAPRRSRSLTRVGNCQTLSVHKEAAHAPSVVLTNGDLPIFVAPTAEIRRRRSGGVRRPWRSHE